MTEILTGRRAAEFREGSLAVKGYPDREAVVYPLVTGTVRLVVGEPGSPFYDDAW